MDTEILRNIGLTDGEIRVYEALIRLGKGSTGPIMKESGISSSKVYLILEKLMLKGLVTYVLEEGIKVFRVANPNTLIDYVEKKEQELDKLKSKAKDLAKEVSALIGTREEESAQIYKGWAGFKVAYKDIIESIDDGGEFLIFSLMPEEFDEKAQEFFKSMHPKRLERGIKTKVISDTSLKEANERWFLKQKDLEVKFTSLKLPTGINIGKDKVLLPLLGDNPIAFEISSRRMAERFKEFFEKMWKTL